MAWALAIGLAAATEPSSAATTSQRMGLIVPAYQYPTLGALWADCAAAASRLPLVAILNPASGPGPAADPAYASAAGAVRAHGGRVIGYVMTSYGTRPLADVLRDVDTYRAQYALDGIFLDAMSNDAGAQPHYVAIRDSIAAREPGWLVVGDPGANTLESYLAAADVIVNFDYYGEAYFTWTPSAWVRNQPPAFFCHLAHTLSTADSMRAAVARAASLNAAWVFVTDDVQGNPWDATPSYWNELVATAETTSVAGTVGVDGHPAVHEGLVAFPNPSRGTVRFTTPAGGTPRGLEVLDVAGRIVCRLESQAWDGRDAHGQAVPAGVYVARDPGNASIRVRFVRLQ